MRHESLCQIQVDNGRSDYDAHGSFWTTWREPCGKSVHKAGRCLAHHNSHLNLLRARIEVAEQTVASARAELEALTERSSCAGGPR